MKFFIADIEVGFLPWLMNEVEKTMEHSMVGRTMLDSKLFDIKAVSKLVGGEGTFVVVVVVLTLGLSVVNKGAGSTSVVLGFQSCNTFCCRFVLAIQRSKGRNLSNALTRVVVINL